MVRSCLVLFLLEARHCWTGWTLSVMPGSAEISSRLLRGFPVHLFALFIQCDG